MKSKMTLYLEKAEAYLEEALPAEKEDKLSAKVTEAMRYSLLCGGKRVRPVLVLAFCELCDGQVEAALSFAGAIEMIHTYSLIHDDLPCMDDDDLRRGKPTCHKVYGEAIALLAGDGLLTKAFETALSCEKESAAVRAASVLAKLAGAEGMVGGQCIDLESDGKEVGLDVLEAMDRGKTVALISAACQMGCIAAGAGEKELDAACRFAEGLGMAFQIRDDILDVLGSAEKLGKNVGMDSAHDKRNYVTLLGAEGAQKLVEDYTEKAISALDDFEGDSAFLKEFALSLVQREF